MRLIIADDHGIIRQGLRIQFENEGIAEIVGEAGDGKEAVALTKELRPDAVIVDIAMPCLNGIEVVRQIRALDATIKLIVLSMHAEQAIVTEALKAGCHAYLLKTSLFDEVATALNAVMKGERYLSPPITNLVVDEVTQPTPTNPGSGLKALTPRERQVLQLTAEGHSVKEIARDLHLSAKTVDATRRKVMRKTDEYSIAGLTKLALRQGLTTMEF